jgi:hypothetical protein
MIHLAILTLIYFLPTIIASHRGHSVGGFAVINFFVGWTGIGWLALMVWAVVSRPRYYVSVQPYDQYGYWRR